jgi:hypothetical protein
MKIQSAAEVIPDKKIEKIAQSKNFMKAIKR